MSALRDEQIQEAQSAFNALITRENLHPDDHAALLRFLQHKMSMNLNTDEVRDPIPDQLNRIRLVYQTKKNLQKKFGDSFVFTHLHQIGILLFGRTFTRIDYHDSRDNLALLEPLLARFLQRSTAIPPDVIFPNPPPPGAKEASRNKTESKDALERDGKRCLVTNAIEPDVCHIIPFGLNSNPATEPGCRLIYGKMLRHILPPQDAKDLLFELLFPNDEDGEPVLASSDKKYNMLTLSTQVRRYWNNCFFAFKWVGVLNPGLNEETRTVQLEFRWMPRSIATALGDEGLDKPKPEDAHKGNAFRPVRTDIMTPERMSEIISDCNNSSSLTSTVQPQYQQPTGEYPTLVDHDSLLPIKSGYIINVDGVKTEDVPKMKLAIDLQYVLIRLGGLSGAADAIESLDPRVPPQSSILYDADTDTVSWEYESPFPELGVLGDEGGEEEGEEEGGEEGPSAVTFTLARREGAQENQG
ncbi:unnamed protein product [Clonostachys solani]|uniref:HNH nuclease domain-containing protein n=1 Tax=Clonostachys solani TaxID=160281 RepID=A0A9N9ZH88_9HYPO|nr:unnamed protein product [Clonostachys solani]